jgi:hypothetical protein
MPRWSLPHLSDEAFDREFDSSLRHHDESSAVMLARLAEFDARRRYLPAGYGTMWDYCRLGQGWSQHVISQRLQAARTAWEFPAIFDLLAAGKLDLCHVRLLAPHLTKQNAAEMLAKAVDRSKRELEAALKPATAVTAEPSAEEHPQVPQQFPRAPGHVEPCGGSFELESPELPRTAEPVAPDDVLLHLHIDRETQELLRHAQALLSRTKGYRDVAKVFNRALKALNERLETKLLGGAVIRKKLRNGGRNPRYIPADVRRKVLLRDGFSCQHVGKNGHVCGATHHLQLDHRKPVAEGGESTVDNVEFVCGPHNRYRAELALGKERVAAGRAREERKRAQRRARRAKGQANEDPARANGAPADRCSDIENALVINFRLRHLEARRIAEEVRATHPGVSLEVVMKEALKRLKPVRFLALPTPSGVAMTSHPVA